MKELISIIVHFFIVLEPLGHIEEEDVLSATVVGFIRAFAYYDIFFRVEGATLENIVNKRSSKPTKYWDWQLSISARSVTNGAIKVRYVAML